VACAAAVALARPGPAAACFVAYGAGRTLMAVLPRRGKEDATGAVEALVKRRRALLAANVGALVVCAALLTAPAAGAARGIGPGFDPAARGSVLARAVMRPSGIVVVVEPRGEDPIPFADSASPSVDGRFLAYADGEGIKVVNWRTNQPVAQVNGRVSKPALDWPLLAYIRVGSEKRKLLLVNLDDSTSATKMVSIARRHDLGRPSLAGGRLAWHVVTRDYSKVVVERLASGARRVIRRSEIAVESNPAVTGTRIVWVEQRARSASLLMRRFGYTWTREIYDVNRRDRRLLTTALTRRTAYVTRWVPRTGDSTLVRVNF
jgi:hypothetical protein